MRCGRVAQSAVAMAPKRVGKFAHRSRWRTNLLYRRVSAAHLANAICSICGLDGAVYISDGTAPECKVCIEHPFWADQRRAVAETHQKRMSDLINKCGKSAGVQLALSHDARSVIAACLYSGFPWNGPDTGDFNMLGTGLRLEFVPAPLRATWRIVNDFHYLSLHWEERNRRTEPSREAGRKLFRSRGGGRSRSPSPASLSGEDSFCSVTGRALPYTVYSCDTCNELQSRCTKCTIRLQHQ